MDKRVMDWPEAEYWKTVDMETLDDAWDMYLAEPENNVNKLFQIYPEPSVQCNCGGMFIYDESDERRFSSIHIDWVEWCNREIEMAMESSTADEYQEKYNAYISSLIECADPWEE